MFLRLSRASVYLVQAFITAFDLCGGGFTEAYRILFLDRQGFHDPKIANSKSTP